MCRFPIGNKKMLAEYAKEQGYTLLLDESSCEEQELYFNDVLGKNERALKDFGIKCGDTIQRKEKKFETINILYVNVCSGKFTP